MTNKQLAAIRERCEAATQGPWFWRCGKAKPLTLHARNMDIVMSFCRSGMSSATAMFNINGLLHKATEIMKPRQGQEHNASFMSDVDHPDAQFIAHSRADVPALLAEVERLRGLVEFAYCEGYEDSKDFEQHWSNSASRARLEGEG